MSLFNRKKDETKPCCCSGSESSAEKAEGNVQSIKVLGAGCKACHQMFENTKTAAADLGIQVEVEYITDMEKVMQYDAMSMPALVVNEKVIAYGKVLKPKEIAKLLS